MRVWDLSVPEADADSGRELHCLTGHTGPVTSVSFSADGRRIVSGGYYGDKTGRVWEAETGECLEVIEGDGDLAAIAAGPEAHAYRALERGREAVIEDAAGGTPVAWFPIGLDKITTHPTQSIWAGGVGSYLCLIKLEGGGKERVKGKG